MIQELVGTYIETSVNSCLVAIPPYITHPVFDQFINAAAWKLENGNTILFGRRTLGPGEVGKPDPSNMEFIELSEDLRVLRQKTVSRPNSNHEQFEDFRAVIDPKTGAVILVGTWVERASDGSYNPRLAMTRVPRNWNGEFGEMVIYSDYEKDGVGWIDDRDDIRVLSRLQGESNYHLLRDRVLVGNDLVERGFATMPDNITEKFWKSGTGDGVEVGPDGRGRMLIHNIEKPGGKLPEYTIRVAEVVTNGKLNIERASTEPLITADQFLDHMGKHIYPSLHPELRGNIVYLCGTFTARIGDRRVKMAAVNVNDGGTVLKPLEELSPAA